MLAAVLYGPGDIRVEEVVEPGPPGASEVLVAPLWCGLCGTDVKEYLGQGASVPDQPHPLTGATKPLILGHEFSARVVATGSDVRHVEAGDRVAVMPLLYCGQCSACVRGDFILCPNKAWVGLSTKWGGLGDRALVRSYQVTPLGPLSDEQGALVEPAAVSLNAVVSAGVSPGDRVLIVGGGPIGALAILGAHLAGASTVYVSEPDPMRAAISVRFGATLVGAQGLDLVPQINDLTAGRGVDVAIDCAGKDGTLNACIQAARPGGTVAVPSVRRGSTEIDILSVTRKPLSLVGSLGYTMDVWERTIALIAGGKYPVERIVTSRASRNNVVRDGFGALAAAGRAELKVLVRVAADERADHKKIVD